MNLTIRLLIPIVARCAAPRRVQALDVARGPLYTVLSFINITKYPTSLLFLSLTLGVALLLLSVADEVPGRLRGWPSTHGKVPMFYYLLHFCLVSGGALV